jgi:hypothetical protein
VTAAGDLRLDSELRHAWAATAAETAHLDEAAWTEFLEGRLDPDARESALDHVAACPRCASVFKAARAAALEAVPHVAKDRAPARPWPQLAALAATLVIGTALATRSFVAPAPSASVPAPAGVSVPAAVPALPRPHLQKPPVVISAEQLLALRGGARDDAYLKALAAALEPYQKDAFREAAIRLAPLHRDHPQAFEAAFYLGVSLAFDGRARESVPVLERALELAPAARRDEAARWLESARTLAPSR